MAVSQNPCSSMLCLCEALKLSFYYVWDPGGCFCHEIKAEGFPFDPGGHVFVATERLEMPFDPGGCGHDFKTGFGACT